MIQNQKSQLISRIWLEFNELGFIISSKLLGIIPTKDSQLTLTKGYHK